MALVKSSNMHVALRHILKLNFKHCIWVPLKEAILYFHNYLTFDSLSFLLSRCIMCCSDVFGSISQFIDSTNTLATELFCLHLIDNNKKKHWKGGTIEFLLHPGQISEVTKQRRLLFQNFLK